jgi:hypothetical protein
VRGQAEECWEVQGMCWAKHIVVYTTCMTSQLVLMHSVYNMLLGSVLVHV